MANMDQANSSKTYDYSGFLFRFMTGRKIPYWVLSILIVLVVFFIPKIIIFEFGLGISWTNIFYISPEYIAAYSDFWGVKTPTLDWLNILGITGIVAFLILNKGLYERLDDLKDFVLKRLEPPSNPEERKNWDHGTVEKNIPVFIKGALKTAPLIFMLIIAIAIPVLDFVFFNYSKFIASSNPNILLFYIQNYYGLAFIYAFVVCMLVLSIGAGIVIYELGMKHNIKPDIMHKDGVAGLKVFGNATIRNLTSWTILAIIIIVNAAILAVTRTQVERLVTDVLLIALTVIFTLAIFYVPLKGSRERLLQEKAEELDKINRTADNLLKVMEERLDVGIIGKKEESKEMVVDPADLLVRLDFMAHSNYYNHVLKMREWPLDNSLILKTIFNVIFPIVLGLLSYFIESLLF